MPQPNRWVSLCVHAGVSSEHLLLWPAMVQKASVEMRVGVTGEGCSREERGLAWRRMLSMAMRPCLVVRERVVWEKAWS